VTNDRDSSQDIFCKQMTEKSSEKKYFAVLWARYDFYFLYF